MTVFSSGPLLYGVIVCVPLAHPGVDELRTAIAEHARCGADEIVVLGTREHEGRVVVQACRIQSEGT